MECSFDLCRMMCIIINDSHAANLSLILETTVCAGKFTKSIKDHFIREPQKLSYCKRCQSVGNIVDSGYFQGTGTNLRTIVDNLESSMSEFIIENMGSSIVSRIFQTIGDDLAGESFCDLLILRCVCVDHKCTVSRKKFCKLTERMTDVINVLKEIQMICIHVQDHADLREET